MSMEHKAFLFDIKKYQNQIEKIIKKCCKSQDSKVVQQYINSHLSEFVSPYTQENLDKDWEKQISSDNLQEYFDFLLTSCYKVEADLGLEYMWDGVNEAIKQMSFMNNPEECVLGKQIVYYGIRIDPGAMGLGIVDIDSVSKIKNLLLEHREMLEQLEPLEDLLYDMDFDELEEAYDDLCNIYIRAEREQKGILFTF